MAASSISVSVNKEEYSKFESDNAVIEVEISASGSIEDAGATNENQLTIQLIKARRSRDVVVLTKTVNLATYYGVSSGDISSTPAYVELDTRLAISTTDSINLIRRGLYFVKVYVTNATSVSGNSSDFYINPITVDRMRRDWAFGLDLQSSDLRTFRIPPRQITGIKVKEVSRNHKLSWTPLTFHINGSQKYLSWDGGSLVPITSSHKEYMLPASGPSSEYVIINADFNRLPSSDTSENLFVEEDKITDTTIRRYINDSIDHVENTLLQVYVEPTQIITDIDASKLTYTGDGGSIVINEDYDFIKNPVSFYPRRPGQWIDIQFPYPSLLRVDQLYGAVANTRVIHINPEWIELAEQSGYVQLVPFNVELAFDFVGLIWVESLRSATPIPNFWHYNLLSGLRECPGDVLELIGKSAAIPILTTAGAAFRGGYSSQSISRDGVSESVSYTSSAIYGVYSASIEDYRNWIKENTPQIKNRYRGPQMIVM